MQSRAEVACAVKLLVHPGTAHGLAVGFEHAVTRIAGCQRLLHAFRRLHAGLHRRVRTLDLYAIEEAGATAGKHADRENEPGQRL